MTNQPTEKQAQKEMGRILRQQLRRQTTPLKMELANKPKTLDPRDVGADTNNIAIQKKVAARA